MQTVIVTVTSDLCTDQRVERTCNTLVKLGFNVLLIGRKLKYSMPMQPKQYTVKRMKLLFTKGPLFYAEYNIRLFFILLFNSANLYFANDLDTLLPVSLISRLKKIPFIFDSHEYFTEVPELAGRTFVKKIWKSIERFALPQAAEVITVNGSIANLFNQEYKREIHIIRNISPLCNLTTKATKQALGLPDMPMIILQGSGINIHRGAEEAVEAMQFLPNKLLLIVGGGDVIDKLKSMVQQLNISSNVMFLSRQTPDKLFEYTAIADIGLSLDKDTNINYKFSLPNKIFSYIQARTPVLASNLPELRKIIEEYNIGKIIENHSPRHIADKINEMLYDTNQLEIWQKNLNFTAHELCWEKEEIKLIAIVKKYA